MLVVAYKQALGFESFFPVFFCSCQFRVRSKNKGCRKEQQSNFTDVKEDVMLLPLFSDMSHKDLFSCKTVHSRGRARKYDLGMGLVCHFIYMLLIGIQPRQKTAKDPFLKWQRDVHLSCCSCRLENKIFYTVTLFKAHLQIVPQANNSCLAPPESVRTPLFLWLSFSSLKEFQCARMCAFVIPYITEEQRWRDQKISTKSSRRNTQSY